MKLALNTSYFLIASSQMTSFEMLSQMMGDKPMVSVHGLHIYMLNVAEINSYALSVSRAGLRSVCYLDRFLLVSSWNDTKLYQNTLDSFFNLIASQYEHLIDVDRNQQNIQNLLRFLSNKLGRINDRVIADFGCGTGISLEVWNSMEIKNARLIGIDRCPLMRQVAAGRGMEVLGPGNLARLAPAFIDGAFASYVFHLISSIHSVRLLWSRIKSGGILIGNFHKDQGMSMLNGCLGPTASIIAHIPNLPERSPHGTYIAYQKK